MVESHAGLPAWAVRLVGIADCQEKEWRSKRRHWPHPRFNGSMPPMDRALLSRHCCRIELKFLPWNRDEFRLLLAMGWERPTFTRGRQTLNRFTILWPERMLAWRGQRDENAERYYTPWARGGTGSRPFFTRGGTHPVRNLELSLRRDQPRLLFLFWPRNSISLAHRLPPQRLQQRAENRLQGLRILR